MASYIFRDDEAGRQFADALIAAAQRGVEVRVLLDSVGAGYFHSREFYRMRRAGVTAARFLHTWLPWRMPFLNMRNHRKLLVVDGKHRLSGRHQYRGGKFRAAVGPASHRRCAFPGRGARWCGW